MSLTGLAFLAIFLTGCTLALVKRPIYGLYTYVAVFYLHPPARWWGASLPSIRWSLTAAAVTVFAIYLHKHKAGQTIRWRDSSILMILFLYTTWMWIQVPWTFSPFQLDGTVLYTKYVILAILMYKVIADEDDFESFCLAHVLGCAYLGWLIFGAPDSGRFEKVGGPGIDNANTLGMHLATGLVFAGFLLLAEARSKYKYKFWLVLGSIPLIMNGLFQTETRGAFVGLVMGGLATIYLKPRRIRTKYYALAFIGALGAIYLANDAIVSRLSTMSAAVDETAEWDNSARSRIGIAEAQLRMFFDYPLGAGHQGTGILSPAYIDELWLDPTARTRASHNTVMTVLVDQGLPGITLLLILFVVVVRVLRRLKAFDRTGLSTNLGIFRALVGGTLATIFGAGMFAQYFKAEVLIWSLTLLAILWRLGTESQQAKTGPGAGDV